MCSRPAVSPRDLVFVFQPGHYLFALLAGHAFLQPRHVARFCWFWGWGVTASGFTLEFINIMKKVLLVLER